MEIDTRLVKYKNNISPNINNLFRESKALIDKLNDFKSVNDSASDALSTSFNSEGGKALRDEIAYTNEAASSISDSIYNDLDTVLDKCKTLSSGIEDLEALYEEYKIVCDSNDESEIKNFERWFTDKQDELLKLYKEIINADLYSGKMIPISGTTTSKDSFVQEKDGIIYQKSMPTYRGKKYDLITDRDIIYDSKKMIQADKEAGNEAVNYLRKMIKSNQDDGALWNFQKNKYSNIDGIAKVMNVVLEDSYVHNKCSSVSEYAAISALVLSQGLVDLKYGSSPEDSTNSLGFDIILKNGASLSNSELICWSYNQGLKKDGCNVIDEDSITNIIIESSKDVSSLSYDELCNLDIGTCVIKQVKNGYQIGMIVGYTKVNDEVAAVIAGAMSNKNGSYSSLYKVKDCFGEEKNKWQKYILSSDIESKVRG